MKRLVLIISVIFFSSCSGNEKETKEVVQDIVSQKITLTEGNEIKEVEKNITKNKCEISDTLKMLFTNLNEDNLTRILEVVVANKNSFSDECVMLTLEDWFNEKATYSFFELIKEKNSSDKSFNGYEYLDKYSIVFKNNAELSEVISEELALLAQQNPYKFISYIENIETKKERNFVLSKPFWNQSIYQSMKEEIEKSKYKDEIINFLKNSG